MILWWYRGPNGYGWRSTADEVTEGIDASGLTAIVTGGFGGIGTETARVLALRGAHVFLAGRNLEAGQIAKDEILEKVPDAKVEVMELDLSSLASVRRFANEFLARNVPLNILINNAGVMACPYQLSVDGVEMQFATNHLGHFLLTNMLLDKMKETSKVSDIEGRIVNVSSMGHGYSYRGGIQFEAINEESRYQYLQAYGQSKLANILHANELTRRLHEEGANVTANSLHPGEIRTGLMRHSRLGQVAVDLFARLFKSKAQAMKSYLQTSSSFALDIVMELSENPRKETECVFLFVCSAWHQGAATTCYVALHPDMKGVSGKYFSSCNVTSPSKDAKDPELAKRLWDLSVEMS